MIATVFFPALRRDFQNFEPEMKTRFSADGAVNRIFILKARPPVPSRIFRTTVRPKRKLSEAAFGCLGGALVRCKL